MRDEAEIPSASLFASKRLITLLAWKERSCEFQTKPEQINRPSTQAPNTASVRLPSFLARRFTSSYSCMIWRALFAQVCLDRTLRSAAHPRRSRSSAESATDTIAATMASTSSGLVRIPSTPFSITSRSGPRFGATVARPSAMYSITFMGDPHSFELGIIATSIPQTASSVSS